MEILDMPVYEYQCRKCEKITELNQLMAEKDNCPPCATCESETFKVITQMQFKLKGGGWAQEGYSNKKDQADLV